MRFEKPTGLEIKEEFSPEKISEEVKNWQEMLDISHSQKKERNEKRIEISHQIIKYLLSADEKSAQRFWKSLEPLFKEKAHFREFKNGILAEVAFMRLLKELRLEEAYPAPVKLDANYGIDFIGKENGRIWEIQVKGKNLSDLEGLMRELRLKPEDLIISLSIRSLKTENLIRKLTGKPLTDIIKKMKIGGEKIKEEYYKNKREKILPLFVILPSGKALKENGEFSFKINKQRFIETLKRVTGVGG